MVYSYTMMREGMNMKDYEVKFENGVYRVYQSINGRLVKIGSTRTEKEATQWIANLRK